MPALAALAMLAGVMVAVMAFETFHFADRRARIRHEISTAIQEDWPAG